VVNETFRPAARPESPAEPRPEAGSGPAGRRGPHGPKDRRRRRLLPGHRMCGAPPPGCGAPGTAV